MNTNTQTSLQFRDVPFNIKTAVGAIGQFKTEYIITYDDLSYFKCEISNQQFIQ